MHDARVEKLERDVRRLKLSAGAVVGALLAVTLLGAMPQEIPQVIQARAFAVIDEGGAERASMNAGGITYYDEHVKPLPQQLVENLETMTGEELRAVLTEIYRSDLRVSITHDGIRYYDENGQTRAELGAVELVTPSTGAETRYRAAVVLYDEDGDVIWRAPHR